MGQNVAILGATDRQDKYAYKAFRMLKEHGHNPLPVSPFVKSVDGVSAVAKLSDLNEKVHTLTMYVGPAKSDQMADEIVALKPGRVIFNPGSENPALEARLKNAGIPFEEACTLLLLGTGQF
jgi:predicted CoA-binding protein